MPGGDRTGPLGQGPMTGGGRGCCTGYASRGAWNGPGFGRGSALGAGQAGRGRGHRNRFYATGVPFWAYGREPEPMVDPEQEVSLLKAEAERLRSALDGVEQRLEQLETE